MRTFNEHINESVRSENWRPHFRDSRYNFTLPIEGRIENEHYRDPKLADTVKADFYEATIDYMRQKHKRSHKTQKFIDLFDELFMMGEPKERFDFAVNSQGNEEWAIWLMLLHEKGIVELYKDGRKMIVKPLMKFPADHPRRGEVLGRRSGVI